MVSASTAAVARAVQHLTLDGERDALRTWLFDAALPLWWERGAHHGPGGGFHDKLGADGAPERRPLRLRVQARQIFVYAEAGRMGWNGPWLQAVDHGFAALQRCFRRPDGLYRAAIDNQGNVHSNDVDLYDQSFVLLALASVWEVRGRPTAIRDEALNLIGRLHASLPHPVLGFEEASPRRLPLRSNPHMHLLEAMLAWLALGEDGVFRTTADAIATLADRFLIDTSTGAVGEFFDGDWSPHPDALGTLREPGHQFEWAYLLDQAGPMLERDFSKQVERLYRFGTTHGVQDGRVIAAVDAAGQPVDRGSRLWQQTERLRAVRTVATTMPLDTHAATIECIAAFRRFLAHAPLGAWHDRLDERGEIIAEGAPASSLYHIVTGLVPLFDKA